MYSKKSPLLIALVALAGCSNALSDLGQRSSQFLNLRSEPAVPVSEPSAVTTIPGPVEELRALTGIAWYREDDPIWGVTGLQTLEAEEIVDIIWSQSSRRDRFVQSSPAEIAAGLPEIEFPSLVPGAVQFASSQLVFAVETGQLSEEYQAAFGLWSVMPYTQSRDVGQRGALWVGGADRVVTYGDPDGELACPDLGVDEARSCRPTAVGTLVGWWHTVPDGGRLVWYEGPYRYELFLRSTTEPDAAVRMAESMRQLAGLVP